MNYWLEGVFTEQCRPLLLKIVPGVRMDAVERDEYVAAADIRVIGITDFCSKVSRKNILVLPNRTDVNRETGTHR